MVWAILVAIVLCGAVGMWLTFRWARGGSSAGSSDLAIYCDQLAALRAELETGDIAADQVDAARREVERRILRAGRYDGSPGPVIHDNPADAGNTDPNVIARTDPITQANWPDRATLLVAALAIILLVPPLLYVWQGEPYIEGQPFTARSDVRTPQDQLLRAIANAEAKLRQQPDDGPLWERLGLVYSAVGWYADARMAFEQAIATNPESATAHSGFGYAEIRLSGGRVNAVAEAAMQRAHQKASGLPEPLFFLALAAVQRGEYDQARAMWRALLADKQISPRWRQAAAQQLANLAQSDLMPLPKLSAETLDSSEKLSAAEQRDMVTRMVARLADRLNKNGRDLAGWLRLVRSYQILGQNDKAVAALDRAAIIFEGDGEALDKINAYKARLERPDPPVGDKK